MITYIKNIIKKSFFKDGELYDQYVKDERKIYFFGLRLFRNVEVFDISDITDFDEKRSPGFKK